MFRFASKLNKDNWKTRNATSGLDKDTLKKDYGLSPGHAHSVFTAIQELKKGTHSMGIV